MSQQPQHGMGISPSRHTIQVGMVLCMSNRPADSEGNANVSLILNPLAQEIWRFCGRPGHRSSVHKIKGGGFVLMFRELLTAGPAGLWPRY